MNREQSLRRIKLLTWVVIAGLILSGATAIPIRSEVGWLAERYSESTVIGGWLRQVSGGLETTAKTYPSLFYGTDWLAFGHFVIATAFIGALRDPVRNRWLFDFGLIACGLVIPYAMIFGELRGIPFWWRLIDCAFGVIGFVPLWFCRRWALKLDAPTMQRDGAM